MSERLCACGCGQPVGSERRPDATFVRGHNSRTGSPAAGWTTTVCVVCGRSFTGPGYVLHAKSHIERDDRFWGKVTRRGDDECWDWNGPLYRGYGRFQLSHEVYVMAHRYAYEQLVAGIPDGLTIDHLCRNRACVNPAHLEPVTSRTNTLRGEAVTAINARKTHCIRGHEYTPENTRYRSDGSRRCWECHRIHDAAARARRSKA